VVRLIICPNGDFKIGNCSYSRGAVEGGVKFDRLEVLAGRNWEQGESFDESGWEKYE
jgi:hypothetical protein